MKSFKASVVRTGFDPISKFDVDVVGVIYNDPSVILLKFSTMDEADEVFEDIISKKNIVVSLNGEVLGTLEYSPRNSIPATFTFTS